MQMWTVEQEDMRKASAQGICPEQSPLAVLPANESTVVPSQPCRTGSQAAFMVFLWGKGSSGSWGELNTCTDAHGVSVCVIRRSGKQNQHFILSLKVFLASWQREMQSKVRKCQEVPAHPATGSTMAIGLSWLCRATARCCQSCLA